MAVSIWSDSAFLYTTTSYVFPVRFVLDSVLATHSPLATFCSKISSFLACVPGTLSLISFFVMPWGLLRIAFSMASSTVSFTGSMRFMVLLVLSVTVSDAVMVVSGHENVNGAAGAVSFCSVSTLVVVSFGSRVR